MRCGQDPPITDNNSGAGRFLLEAEKLVANDECHPWLGRRTDAIRHRPGVARHAEPERNCSQGEGNE
jgi:hypothetical protein